MRSTDRNAPLAHVKQLDTRHFADCARSRRPVRSAHALPDVPTVAEQGLTGYDVSSWHAVLAPAKTPAPIIGRLNKELVAILRMPDIQEKLSSEGGEVSPTAPEEAAAFIRAEVAKWSKLLKEADIPLE